MKPKVLVVTSALAPTHSVMCVVAALHCRDVELLVIDSGVKKDSWEGAIEQVFRTLVGDSPKKKIHNVSRKFSPDVVICFEPTSGQLLTEQRTQGGGAPVIGVVSGPEVHPHWSRCPADRFVVADDLAAIQLEDSGVDGHRIIPIGYFCEVEFSEWGKKPKASVKQRFSVSGRVVVVEVDRFGFEQTSSLVNQLGLIGNSNVTYLFDAGKDKDAATALRARVPATGLKAKLFGATGNTPAYWRSADVIVARPTLEAISRANVVGAKFVALMPESERQRRLSAAACQRNHTALAATFLMIPTAIEQVAKVRRGSSRDAAGNLADIAWQLGQERNAVLEERRSQQREDSERKVADSKFAKKQLERMTAAAGDLEDLGGGGGPSSADFTADTGLGQELRLKKQQLETTIEDAQRMAGQWDRQASAAKKSGKTALEKRSIRNAESERARMHAALAEMAVLMGELEKLQSKKGASSSRSRPSTRRSPVESVDATLKKMKRKKSKSVDDELAALKRRAKKKK